jgi:hypothetical protein
MMNKSLEDRNMNKWLRKLLFVAIVLVAGAAIFKLFLHKPKAKQEISPDHSNRIIVTVTGTVSEFRGYDHNHQHEFLLVDNIQVKQVKNGSASEIPHRAFVAIRIDRQGIHQRIYVHPGDPIELKGEFIPYNQAFKTRENCCDAVIHFTHHPVGYVLYHGKYYN